MPAKFGTNASWKYSFLPIPHIRLLLGPPDASVAVAVAANENVAGTVLRPQVEKPGNVFIFNTQSLNFWSLKSVSYFSLFVQQFRSFNLKWYQ